MKKILITGANGFIGSRLCAFYKQHECYTIGVDRKLTDHGDCDSFIEVDLLNEALAKRLEELCPDIIIHCAGSADVGYSIKHPLDDFKKNTHLTYNLLQGMKESGLVKTRVLFLSSASVYGQPTHLPITEDFTISPISPYALHKKIGEDVCTYFIQRHGFDIKILRIFSAYGPGIKKQIFWDMHMKLKNTGKLSLFGDGHESRDFIYIDDLMKAIYTIAMEKRLSEHIFNIGSGEETSIRDIAFLFLLYSGVDTSILEFNNIIKQGDPRNWRADISRLEAVGFNCKTSIEQGIKNYVDWLKVQSL